MEEKRMIFDEGTELLDLAFSAELKVLAGFAVLCCLIFLPAGDVYFGGVLFLCVLFIPILIAGIVLLIKDPALLKRRIDGKEKEKTQRGVVALSGLMFLGGFLLCGFDHRFSWLPMPGWVSITAAVIFLVGYGMYAEVMRENTYLSRTIKVEEDQKVIDTGMYGIVRHPMYLATVIMFLMIPLILGSLIALPVFLIYPLLMAVRIGNEEKLLCRELRGYRAYKKKVKYRMIPFVW